MRAHNLYSLSLWFAAVDACILTLHVEHPRGDSTHPEVVADCLQERVAEDLKQVRLVLKPKYS